MFEEKAAQNLLSLKDFWLDAINDLLKRFYAGGGHDLFEEEFANIFVAIREICYKYYLEFDVAPISREKFEKKLTKSKKIHEAVDFYLAEKDMFRFCRHHKYVLSMCKSILGEGRRLRKNDVVDAHLASYSEKHAVLTFDKNLISILKIIAPVGHLMELEGFVGVCEPL